MTPVRTRSRWLRLVAALALVVAAFVYGVLPSLVSAKNDVHLLGDASVPLLVLAFLLEVTALATYTGLTRAILPAGLPVGGGPSSRSTSWATARVTRCPAVAPRPRPCATG